MHIVIGGSHGIVVCMVEGGFEVSGSGSVVVGSTIEPDSGVMMRGGRLGQAAVCFGWERSKSSRTCRGFEDSLSLKLTGTLELLSCAFIFGLPFCCFKSIS